MAGSLVHWLWTSASTSRVTAGIPDGQGEQTLISLARRFAQDAILSSSGWRAVCAADGGEHSLAEASAEAVAFFTLAGYCFCRWLDRGDQSDGLNVLLASDTRPTCATLRSAAARGAGAAGARVRDAGEIGTPPLLSWSRTAHATGFIMITASHNPPGWNGLKFGLADGRVLGLRQSTELREELWELLESEASLTGLEAEAHLSLDAPRSTELEQNASEAISAYREDILAIGGSRERSEVPVLGELNGSARIQADTAILPLLTSECSFLNSVPGTFAHGMVPEGPNLEPARLALDQAGAATRRAKAGLRLAYVPDCDGDRGTLLLSSADGPARALGAQETFALAVAVGLDRELDRPLARNASADSGPAEPRLAVVANGATSLRVDEICETRGVPLFRCETGEANVVARADELEAEGYRVPVRGEGSNGGSIISPLGVRDPLALLALLLSADGGDGTGIMATLAGMPGWSGSSAYDDAALLRLKLLPDGLAQSVVNRCSDSSSWPGITEGPRQERERVLKLWWSCLSGTRELPMVTHDPENSGAGLRIVAVGEDDRRVAGLWMRPSRTEPVFRLMAEVARRPDESPEEGELRMHQLLRWFRAEVIAAVDELDRGAITP